MKKLKVLLTGMTTRMVNSPRVQRDYITFSYVLADILREMGHEVHHKEVAIGEKIAYNYNYAFCGVAPLSSMTCGRINETIYVMDQLRGRHCVYFDDWSACGFGKSIRYAMRDWQKFVDYKRFPYDVSITNASREFLKQMIATNVLTAANNAPVLAPMFPWGNHKFLMEDNYSALLFTVDPSAWVKYPTTTIPIRGKKNPRWVMAALSDHTKWIARQNFKLPVTYVGNVRMGVPVLTEAEIVQLFADNFGILSTGYPSAGSGWWRTRYLNAAWAESLVYCDPIDQKTMGKPYQGNSVEFENLLGTKAYYERVDAQREWLEKNISKKIEVVETMERLMA